MRLPTIALLLFLPQAAMAQGFLIRDLRVVAEEAKGAVGERFVQRAAADRITMTCPVCEGAPVVDIRIGRQTDGTEERVRSGETPLSRLEQQCRERSPACRFAALEVRPAVGWISTYPIGATAGATAVILRGGDLLTIRSLSSDGEVAKSNTERLVRRLAPRIVGR